MMMFSKHSIQKLQKKKINNTCGNYSNKNLFKNTEIKKFQKRTFSTLVKINQKENSIANWCLFSCQNLFA